MKHFIKIAPLIFLLFSTSAFPLGEGGISTDGGISEGVGTIHGQNWWHYGLTFWAPLDNPDSPLRLERGAGSFTFTRAHDATHTGTYLHPGTEWVTVADNNQLRIEAGGALIEGARTNSLLWSRTFDNAAWVKTNTTVAANQVGEDGVDNTAYTLTASDANGTLCQNVTADNVAYTGSFSIKRIAGTGAVQISLDNGASYGSDLAGSLSTLAWYRASKANQTLPNPTLCLRLATSGDNVIIDYAQIEAGAFASSRIPTTTAAVTRNADALTVPTAGIIDNAVGTIYLEVNKGAGNPAGQAAYPIALSAASGIDSASGSMRVRDGTGAPGTAWNDANQHKAAIRWGAGEMAIVLDGGVISTDAFDGSMNAAADMYIGSKNGVDYPIFGHVRNIRAWNRAFTDAEIQAVTQ